jgi:phosphohistidine phosphatase SixA
MKPRAIAIPLIIAAAISLMTATAVAQSVSNDMLVKGLQKGGYVIVMRHASSPRETPDEKTANADNVNHERQLDEAGRASAIAMGNALRQLRIPIGQVFSSPTYRALETVRLAQFPAPTAVAELGENGQSMGGVTDAQAAWLPKKITELPKGTNTIVITHFPNMTKAFPQWTSALADGEALVFGSNGNGGSTLVARVKIEEWPKFQP